MIMYVSASDCAITPLYGHTESITLMRTISPLVFPPLLWWKYLCSLVPRCWATNYQGTVNALH